jgi:protocatechuate 3,4-dioxygenase beta subunit
MGRGQRGGFRLVLVYALLFPLVSFAQQPPAPPVRTAPTPGLPQRDAPADPQQLRDNSNSTLKGRVVALDTGAPLRRVQLRLTGGKLRQGRATLTDADGRYEFGTLSAGRYQLSASKGGYVTLQYGQRGPRDSGRAIELAAQQKLEKIDIALPRGAVITGRVVDELGEPVSDMSVMALQYRTMGGKRRLVPVNNGRAGGTNDIGQYRIYGLPPGDYYVSVLGRQGAMISMDAQSDDTTGVGYAQTFYPGTPSAAEAQHVTVGVGEEVAADIQLVLTRVARVSGTVVTASGKPPTMGMVTLRPRGSEEGGGGIMNAGGGQVRPDGTFTISGVPAGTYQLIVMANPGTEMAIDRFESFSQPITVSGQDISDLRVMTTKGITLSGHVSFEGATPDATALKQFQPGCFPLDPETIMFSDMATLNEQQQFEIKGVSSPCVVTALGAPSGWMLKSVQLNGIDAGERMIEPAGKSITGFELTFTNRVTTLTGSVQDAQNQPAKEYTVVVFPEESRRWQPPFSARYLRRARPDQTGTFKFTALPPARYLVVAFDNIEEGLEMDPEFLTKITPLATRVELSESGTQSLSLKISSATGLP